MSRRSTIKNAPPFILNGVTKEEYRIKNYLHLNDIQRGNNLAQTVIIHTFFNLKSGLPSDTPWKEKLKFINERFGKFAMYAQNNWKQKS